MDYIELYSEAPCSRSRMGLVENLVSTRHYTQLRYCLGLKPATTAQGTHSRPSRLFSASQRDPAAAILTQLLHTSTRFRMSNYNPGDMGKLCDLSFCSVPAKVCKSFCAPRIPRSRKHMLSTGVKCKEPSSCLSRHSHRNHQVSRTLHAVYTCRKERVPAYQYSDLKTRRRRRGAAHLLRSSVDFSPATSGQQPCSTRRNSVESKNSNTSARWLCRARKNDTKPTLEDSRVIRAAKRDAEAFVQGRQGTGQGTDTTRLRVHLKPSSPSTSYCITLCYTMFLQRGIL